MRRKDKPIGTMITENHPLPEMRKVLEHSEGITREQFEHLLQKAITPPSDKPAPKAK